jgi:XTP/dITP diphosphohydrolase
LLIVLATSPRVAPGLLSWPAWEALRSASVVLAPPGHPVLPALDEAGIAYQVAAEPPPDPDAVVVWLPVPGAEPELPDGAQLIRGSADLPGAHLIDLVATMDRLRADCPWDARQTHASLAPHLLEEPYEALEALESGDEQALCEELGDVTVSGADEVKRNWDEIKREEKRVRAERQGLTADEQAPPSALDGVPFGQPALALAAQLQRRAARAGVPDELARLDGDNEREDIGRELLRLVARARELGLDPEMELRAAARRYRDRVHAWEHR